MISVIILSVLVPVDFDENYYTKYIADNLMTTYEREAVLWDKSRVDLLGEYAIEVDWAKSKWKEGIGQALYYSATTGRAPGLILLTKDLNKDKPDIYKAIIAANKASIKVWVFDCEKREFIK